MSDEKRPADVACNWCAEYVPEEIIDTLGCCSDGCAARLNAWERGLHPKPVRKFDMCRRGQTT